MSTFAVIQAESSSVSNEEHPTLQGSALTKLWSSAALTLSRKLVECARLKRRCPDIFDPESAEVAFRMAKELLNISRVLDTLDNLHPEMAAGLRRASVDRIVLLHDLSTSILPLISAAQECRTSMIRVE